MKRCRTCKKPFDPFNTLQVCCSAACSIAYARLTPAEKQAKQRKRLAAAEKREAREKLMSMNQLYALAQKAVNAYVRMRDAHKGCISCESGRVDDAGHLFPIGSKWRCHPLRLDIRLIHGQCRKCNSYTGGGNVHGYLAGLTDRYGRGYVDECYAIKNAAERGEIAPLTREEVKERAVEFNRLVREQRRAA